MTTACRQLLAASFHLHIRYSQCAERLWRLTTDDGQLYVSQIQHIRAGYDHELAQGTFVGLDGEPVLRT